MAITYTLPSNWIDYRWRDIAKELAEAKASVLSLQTTPYQRVWVEALQQMQLKLEVAGTSRIEGAEFTERELDIAMKETPEQLRTRSQRQAHAAMQTYRWICSSMPSPSWQVASEPCAELPVPSRTARFWQAVWRCKKGSKPALGSGV